MFQTVAILGAGDLGGSLALRLASAEGARRVLLLDADEGRARGKALDILQAGPVEGFDTRVEGGTLQALESADAIVIADPPEAGPGRLPSEAAALLDRALPALGDGVLVVAAGAPALLQAAVKKGLARERVVGSAPVAIAAGLRRRIAAEAHGRATDVALTLMGRPPDEVLIPVGTVTLGGLPADADTALAVRRALAAVRGRWPGPVALAAAAVRVLAGLDASDPSILPVFAVLAGEYGHRGRVAAVPARLGRGRILSVVEIELAPVDRVAFDNAASRD